MAIVRSPDSAYEQELAKWEAPPGGWPYQPYPKMLYKARKLPNGKVIVLDWDDPRTGFVIVQNEAEERIQLGQGYYCTQQEALDGFERQEQAVAQAGAEVEYAVERMSKPAKREHRKRAQATASHVTE